MVGLMITAIGLVVALCLYALGGDGAHRLRSREAGLRRCRRSSESAETEGICTVGAVGAMADQENMMRSGTTDAGQPTRAARRPLLREAALAIDIVHPEEAAELRDLLLGQPHACVGIGDIGPVVDAEAMQNEARTLRFAVAALGALRSCGNKLGSETRDNNDGRDPSQLPNLPPFPTAQDDTSTKRFWQVARDVWMEWPEESSEAWRQFHRRQLDIAASAIPLRDRMAPGVGLDIVERVWAFTDGAWRPVSAALCFEVKRQELAIVVALAIHESKGLELTLERVLLVALRADGRLYDKEWDSLRRWAADVLRSHMPLNG